MRVPAHKRGASVEAIEEALRTETDTPFRAEMLARLAIGLAANDPSRAESELAEAERLVAELAAPPVPVGAVAAARAFLAVRNGAYDDAIDHADRAVRALASLDDSVGRLWRAEALHWRGSALQSKGELARAIDTFEQSLEIRSVEDDSFAIATSLNVLGNCWQDCGDLKLAYDFYQRCYEIASGAGGNQRLLAIVLNNLGNIRSRLGDHPTAIVHYTRALDILRDTHDGDVDNIRGHALNNLGKVHEELGDSATALRHSMESLAVRERTGIAIDIAMSLNNVGVLHEKLGNLDLALEYTRRSLEMFQRIGSRANVALAKSNLANHLLREERIDEADELLADALTIARETGATTVLVHVLDTAVAVYRRRGEFEKALAAQEEHFTVRESLRNDEAQRQLATIEAARELELARKEAEIERLRNVELARAHDELKQTQAQLVHAGKMASIGQLTAGVAHEINNPTNFVRSSISPLRRDLLELREIYHRIIDELPPDARAQALKGLEQSDRAEIAEEIDRLLDGIDDGATRIAEIVRGLRLFTRLDEDLFKRVDLHEGIDGTLALLRPELGEITVERDYGELPLVECSPGQINQVFMNLLSNAIDAIDGAGTIRIATAHDGDVVRIEITDTGTGIPEELRARIFEPFFTTKPVGKGQGLGLSVSHGIVEKHGGTIAVQHHSGRGTTFTVVLPVAQHAPTPF